MATNLGQTVFLYDAISPQSSKLANTLNICGVMAAHDVSVVMLTNELCVATYHYGKVPKAEIITVMNGFYTDDEVVKRN